MARQREDVPEDCRPDRGMARAQERGSVLPDNEVFGRKADVEASPSTYKRAKQFLVTHGVLEANDGPFYVA